MLYFNPGLMLNQLLTTGPWALEADLPLVGKQFCKIVSKF